MWNLLGEAEEKARPGNPRGGLSWEDASPTHRLGTYELAPWSRKSQLGLINTELPVPYVQISVD